MAHSSIVKPDRFEEGVTYFNRIMFDIGYPVCHEADYNVVLQYLPLHEPIVIYGQRRMVFQCSSSSFVFWMARRNELLHKDRSGSFRTHTCGNKGNGGRGKERVLAIKLRP